MIPSFLEKLVSGVTILFRLLQHRMFRHDFIFAGVELLFALLFVIAYFLTPQLQPNSAWRTTLEEAYNRRAQKKRGPLLGLMQAHEARAAAG